MGRSLKKSNEEKEKSKKRVLNPYMTKLLQSAVSMVVCVVIIICAVFAWFQSSKIVTATGAAAQVIGLKTLKVAATAGGEDISTLSVPQNLLIVNVENDEPELRPSTQGDFSVFITPNGTNGDNVIKITPQILAGGIDNLGNVVEDYRDDIFSGTEKTQAINYVNGHILLFSSYNSTTGVYSGWVDPFGETQFTLRSGEETELKFYWVWVDSYYKLCDGSELISPTDITAIRKYYYASSDYTQHSHTYLFDTRGFELVPTATLSQLTHYYDFADGDIGSVVSHIFFRLSIKA